MQINRKYLAIGASVVALAATGTGVAVATSGSEDAAEQATGPGVAQARSAALDITGGGTANSVEFDNENGATWEVEVTRPDGATVDVRLDDQYKLVVVEGDSEASDGSE